MSFDWVTFGLQLVNLLVLLAILKHFFFRPVSEIVARRQAQVQAIIDAADNRQKEAQRLAEAAHAERVQTETARDAILDSARKDGEARTSALLDEARATAARVVADAEDEAARKLAAADEEALRRVSELAVTIAHRAFSELPQPPTPAAFARRLADTVATLSPERRQALLRGGNLHLVSAQTLAEDDLSSVREQLRSAGIEIAGSTIDPALIAGLELRSDSGVVRNSLAHNLQQLSEALRNDNGSRA
jgi:F-type H+-transporting ATPase subunit b